MALQGLVVPSPAQGTDWSYTVPGQYVLDVRAVTAQLVTTSAPTNAADSSGNANIATYFPGTTATFGITGPFGGGGGFAVGLPDLGNTNALATFANGSGQLDAASFTMEAIVWMDNNVDFHNIDFILVDRIPFGAERWGWGYLPGVSTGQPRGFDGAGSLFNIGGTFSGNAWHHLAVTQSGGTWTPYLDGVAGTAVSGHNIGAGPLDNTVALAGDESGTGQNIHGKVAAIAFYSAVLPGANIAAHHAAIATSAAAYKAAVLADTPTALWMLDEVVTSFQRSVTLQVTDGTNLLGQFPGFEPVQQSPVFRFTWATDVSSATQSGDQSVTFLPIPALRLYPGMVLRTNTLDIRPTDQWSNVVVWADTSDSSIPPDGGGPGTVGYLDATLYPDVPIR